jgi:DNA-binding NarL/FixJ family response regulator
LDVEKTMIKTDIWLVEDNLRYRTTLTNLINRTPTMSCSQVFSRCEDALEKLVDLPSPDIILLDIGLPGINGIEGLQQFKKVVSATHVIMLTVYDDSDKVFDALCAGASGYLLKDSTPEKIIASIEEVLAGGAPMNMQIARKVLDMFSRLKPVHSNYGLTDREKEILQHLVAGLTKQQIADQLFLSFHTVNTHCKNIYSKLHVNTLSGAISKAYRENLI